VADGLLAEGVSAQSTTSMFVYQALGNRARSVSTNRYAISSRFRARAPLSIEEITTLAAPAPPRQPRAGRQPLATSRRAKPRWRRSRRAGDGNKKVIGTYLSGKLSGLMPVEDFRRDSDLFGAGARNPEVQNRLQAALKRGLQTRDAEMDLARFLGDLPDH
jgi:hypothetical protein